MSFAREGIENVRVHVLPDGIAADGTYAAVSRAALVTWHASCAGMLHQVYVNGRYAGTTIDAEQRKLVAPLPSAPQGAVRVEVVAVEPQEAHVDFAALMESPPAGSGRIRLVLLRSQTLPLDATANIYFDHGAGQINYTQPLNAAPVPIWPCRQDKAGFGMAGSAQPTSATIRRRQSAWEGAASATGRSDSMPTRSSGSARLCRSAGTGLASRS